MKVIHYERETSCEASFDIADSAESPTHLFVWVRWSVCDRNELTIEITSIDLIDKDGGALCADLFNKLPRAAYNALEQAIFEDAELELEATVEKYFVKDEWRRQAYRDACEARYESDQDDRMRREKEDRGH